MPKSSCLLAKAKVPDYSVVQHLKSVCNCMVSEYCCWTTSASNFYKFVYGIDLLGLSSFAVGVCESVAGIYEIDVEVFRSCTDWTQYHCTVLNSANLLISFNNNEAGLFHPPLHCCQLTSSLWSDEEQLNCHFSLYLRYNAENKNEYVSKLRRIKSIESTHETLYSIL